LGVWGARAALPIESAPVASLVYTKLKINKKQGNAQHDIPATLLKDSTDDLFIYLPEKLTVTVSNTTRMLFRLCFPSFIVDFFRNKKCFS